MIYVNSTGDAFTRATLQYWAEYAAIQRDPQQAARLRHLEAAAGEAEDITTLNGIVAEIQEIFAWAERRAETLAVLADPDLMEQLRESAADPRTYEFEQVKAELAERMRTAIPGT